MDWVGRKVETGKPVRRLLYPSGQDMVRPEPRLWPCGWEGGQTHRHALIRKHSLLDLALTRCEGGGKRGALGATPAWETVQTLCTPPATLHPSLLPPSTLPHTERIRAPGYIRLPRDSKPLARPFFLLGTVFSLSLPGNHDLSFQMLFQCHLPQALPDSPRQNYHSPLHFFHLHQSTYSFQP